MPFLSDSICARDHLFKHRPQTRNACFLSDHYEPEVGVRGSESRVPEVKTPLKNQPPTNTLTQPTQPPLTHKVATQGTHLYTLIHTVWAI